MQKWPSPAWQDRRTIPSLWKIRPSMANASMELAWWQGDWNTLEHKLLQTVWENDSPSMDQDLGLAWAQRLNYWPTPPKIWNAYLRSNDHRSKTSLDNCLIKAGAILWERWPIHAAKERTFQEWLRRVESLVEKGWSIDQSPEFSNALLQSWSAVDASVDRYGQHSALLHRFTHLVERMHRWGVIWDQTDKQGWPLIWQLLHDQWAFVPISHVDEYGWLGRVLHHQPNVWNGPYGFQSWWAEARRLGVDGLCSEEHEQECQTWNLLQRTAETALLRQQVCVDDDAQTSTRARL